MHPAAAGCAPVSKRQIRHKALSDYDKKNVFDVEAYMKRQLRIRMKEEFELFEVDAGVQDDEGNGNADG